MKKDQVLKIQVKNDKVVLINGTAEDLLIHALI
jgi:hypothetical protein